MDVWNFKILWFKNTHTKNINPKKLFNMKSSWKKYKYVKEGSYWNNSFLTSWTFFRYRLTLIYLLYFHVFSIATVTNYHKFSGLSTTHLLLYNSEGQKSHMGQQGCILSEGSRGELVSLLFPTSRGCPHSLLGGFAWTLIPAFRLYILLWLWPSCLPPCHKDSRNYIGFIGIFSPSQDP